MNEILCFFECCKQRKIIHLHIQNYHSKSQDFTLDQYSLYNIYIYIDNIFKPRTLGKYNLLSLISRTLYRTETIEYNFSENFMNL